MLAYWTVFSTLESLGKKNQDLIWKRKCWPFCNPVHATWCRESHDRSMDGNTTPEQMCDHVLSPAPLPQSTNGWGSYMAANAWSCFKPRTHLHNWSMVGNPTWAQTCDYNWSPVLKSGPHPLHVRHAVALDLVRIQSAFDRPKWSRIRSTYKSLVAISELTTFQSPIISVTGLLK